MPPHDPVRSQSRIRNFAITPVERLPFARSPSSPHGGASTGQVAHQDRIRNFAIIAHVDHGKSTLADRLLELTGTIAKREMRQQILDSNPIERERGITIKLAPVRMKWGGKIVDGKWKVVMENGKSKLENTPSSNFQSPLPISDFQQPISPFILNLIDTPGHVDFSYEVSRSLAACEGALLVVDATQGVQAQTIANLQKARQHNLVIIPVINKIDLPNARIGETRGELGTLGFQQSDILEVSAKTGENVEKVLEAIVQRIPAPQGGPDKPLRALVFSSQYDNHKGVIVFVRVVDGLIPPLKGSTLHGVSASTPGVERSDSRLLFMASRAHVSPIEVGYFTPHMTRADGISTGEVGYIATGLKDARLAKVGDTITISNIPGPSAGAGKNSREAGSRSARQISNIQIKNQKETGNSTIQQFNNITIKPLPGYKEPKAMVFLGLFPIAADELTASRVAMEKLRLSDGAFTFRPISSLALGNGFQCGFLGLLHAEIVQERLTREFGITMIATAPSVEYRIRRRDVIASEAKQSLKIATPSERSRDDNTIAIQSAAEFPDPSVIEEVREPVMNVTIYSPKPYVGAIMRLAQEKRGEYVNLAYFGASGQHSQRVALQMASGGSGYDTQCALTYLIPLAEMIVDFFDRLKSISQGYASLDYEFFDPSERLGAGYQPVKVVKVDILVNKERVDAFSLLVVASQAQREGRAMVERLAEVIPRQQFAIPIQAAVGSNIIARADVKAFRKDVTQKLYGGDRTRKDKLLKKQKKGKERMKMVGNVQIPQTAFFEVLKRE